MLRRILLALVVVVCATGFAAPAHALPGLPSPCDLAPSGPLQDACNIGQGVANPVAAVGGAVGVVGDVGSVAGVDLPGPAYLDDAFQWLIGMFADSIKTAMDGLGQMLDAAPAPPIDQEWFAQEYKPLMSVGLSLCFVMALGYFAWYGLRGHTFELWHSFKLFLIAIFATATAPLFMRMALQAADALTAGFAAWGGAEAGQFTDRITQVTSNLTIGDGVMAVVGPVLTFLFLFFSVCMVLVWMVLLTLRAELIYIGTLGIPFVLPSIIDGYGRFARVYFKALFGLVITKPILIGTLCAGAWLIERGAFGADGIQALVAGFSIFLVATLGCFFLFKLLGIATPIVLAVERGGRSAVAGVRDAGKVAAGVAAGPGYAVAEAAADGASTPRTKPPRPRGGS
jgi:hypothetical protein